MVMPISRAPLPGSDADGRTRLRLATGTSWVLEVAAPPVPTTTSLPASCFADNGFPSAVLGMYIEQITVGLADAPGSRLRVFGHVAPSGDAASDKRRSDALAQSMHAVLVGDETAFTALAEQQGWGVREDQAMLRALGDHPAAIDGEAGALTGFAVRCFQEEWNWGWHHPDGATSPLSVTGALDGMTRASLRRAYLLMIAGQVGEEAFLETGWSGCGSYVPVLLADGLADAAATAAGRVVVAVYGERRPRAFPCVAEDPGACRIDDVAATRCRFYRHAVAAADARAPDTFFDFEWLPLPSGKVNLSVLTSLPDGARPTFTVFLRVDDFDGRVRRGAGVAPAPRGPVLAAVTGIVSRGVAVAMFDPADVIDDWSPFEIDEWWGDPERGEPVGLRPPIFRVQTADGPDGLTTWADSTAPGRRLDRIPVEDVDGSGIALTTEGRVIEFTFDDRRAWPGERRRADELLRVVAWQSSERAYESMESQEDDA